MSPRWPWPLRRGRIYGPTLLRVYLLGGAVVMAVALLLYFHSLALRVERQTEAKGDLVAHVLAFTTLNMEGSADSTVQARFRSVIRSLDFPVIIASDDGFPLVWNARVGVGAMSIDAILSEDPAHPSPGFARVLHAMARMDRNHDPLPMVREGTGAPVVYLHYGSPSLINELRWTPLVTIAVAALFGLVGLLMLRSMKRAEQGFIWAGMAKETAHQMGTPLSSLVGWLEVLREETRDAGDRAILPRDLYEEAVAEIGRDAERLNRVAARFSQIGSQPRLERAPVGPVVQQTVDYFRRRFPQHVVLDLEMAEGLPEVEINAELLGWVLENLLKNAMNAADKRAGRVEVRVRSQGGGRGVVVTVRDNGRGVVAGMETQIFRPGVSTRQRGWGLGLPLSRRIVEEYHGGRLDLLWTEPGKGAEFAMTLPAAGTRRVR